MTEVSFTSEMGVQLIDWMGGDSRVVQAARTSTKGANDPEPGEGRGLVNFLHKEHHEVPFEHSVFTFRLHVPIFVSRQLVKHRITSISEESGRYKELDPVFYVPPPERPVVQIGKTGAYNFIQDQYAHDQAEFWIADAARESWDTYELLLDRGIAKEVARMVLPVNTYGTMYMTINARSMFNFLSLRTDHHAQKEIRDLAGQVADVFAEKMPWTYAAWAAAQENRIDLRDINMDAVVAIYENTPGDSVSDGLAAVFASLKKEAR